MTDKNIRKIDIYSINDFHGVIEPLRHFSSASVFSKLLQLKNRNPENTIIVSSGDMFESPPLMKGSPGHLTIQLMNLVNTTAMTVGNHDFDWFPKRKSYLQELQKQLCCPLLACNIINKSTGKRPEFIKPSIIVNLSGIKVAFIGLITEECSQICLKEELGKIQVVDSVSSLKEELARVKQLGADICIGLGHVGAFQDTPGGVIKGETAGLLHHFNSRDLQGFVTAHTHQYVTGTINDIHVVQAGSFGEGIGHFECLVNAEYKEILDISAKIIKIEKIRSQKTLNPDILKLIQKGQKETTKSPERIGYTARDLTIDYGRETFWGKFVAESMQKLVNADLGIINPGAFRTPMKAGELHTTDIIQNLPFDNTVCKIQLKGEVIKKILQRPVNPSMGILQTTGTENLDDDRFYTSAVSSFLAAGGDGYSEFTSGSFLEDSGVIIRDAVIKRIKEDKSVILKRW